MFFDVGYTFIAEVQCTQYLCIFGLCGSLDDLLFVQLGQYSSLSTHFVVEIVLFVVLDVY